MYSSGGRCFQHGRGDRNQFLGRGVLERLELLPAAAGGVLLGTVEPEALQDSAVLHGVDQVDTRPFLQTRTRFSLHPWVR